MISNSAFTQLRQLIKNGQSVKSFELLLNLQARFITLQEETRHLRLRISNFENLLACSKNTSIKDGLVWLNIAGVSKGPFCSLCHDTDKSLIALEQDGADWRCPACNALYGCPASGRSAVIVPIDKAKQVLDFRTGDH